jgi:hypothetical protein
MGVLCTEKWGMLKISKKTILALEVTEEQKETIYHLFSHNNWDFNEIEIKVNENNVRGEINQTGTPENFYDFSIEQDDDFDECQYCLCKPCITHEDNRQMWWETENQMPQERNSMLAINVFGLIFSTEMYDKTQAIL